MVKVVRTLEQQFKSSMFGVQVPRFPVTAARTVLPTKAYCGGLKTVLGCVVMTRVRRKPAYNGPASFA